MQALVEAGQGEQWISQDFRFKLYNCFTVAFQRLFYAVAQSSHVETNSMDTINARALALNEHRKGTVVATEPNYPIDRLLYGDDTKLQPLHKLAQ
jgi:hypothetical protein